MGAPSQLSTDAADAADADKNHQEQSHP